MAGLHSSRFPRLGRVPRLCLAGICLLLAAGGALSARSSATRAPAHTTAVVVATREHPAGHLPRARDLRVARWPDALRPAGVATAVSALTGRRLAGPLDVRDPVTRGLIVGRDLTDGLPPGTVATSVTVSDPQAAQLVRAGDRVDLLASPASADPFLDDGTTSQSGGDAGAVDADVGHGRGDAAADDVAGDQRADGAGDSGGDETDGGRPDGSAVHTLAVRLLVLAVLDSSGDAGPAVVVATDRRTAVRIAGQVSGTRFTVLGDSP